MNLGDKIIYVAREKQDEQYGGSVVAERNHKTLIDIFGRENVIEVRLPKTSLKTVFQSLIRLGGYGVPKKCENYICCLQKEYKIKYAFIEGTLTSSIVERLKSQGCIITVFAHNVEKHLYLDRHKEEKTILSMIRQKYIAFCEKKVINITNHLIVLNERDYQGHLNEYGKKADIILPITFEDHSSYAQLDTDVSNHYILFVGSDFFPNNHGIKWFIKNVAPYIGRFKIIIVGGCGKSNELLSIKDLPQNVIIKGYVDNIDKYYQNADAVIAPIFSGSGMKTKTVEALSYGKTIFGTDEAFVGIEGDLEEIGGLCNNAESFIKKISQYKGGKTNRYSQRIFKEFYSNNSFCDKLKEFFIKIEQ